jgi:hypothetical protein
MIFFEAAEFSCYIIFPDPENNGIFQIKIYLLLYYMPDIWTRYQKYTI